LDVEFPLNPIFSIIVIRFPGVDVEQPSIIGKPSTVFDIFPGVEDSPTPGLFEG
jgi:hypothetical protein